MQRHIFKKLSNLLHIPKQQSYLSVCRFVSTDVVNVESIKMATVVGKKATLRTARALTTVQLPQRTFDMIIKGELPKVSSLETLVAAIQLAGVSAAKRTPDLLPLCHPIPISNVQIKVGYEVSKCQFHIESMVVTDGATTGVEMEALVSANVSALVLYDIAKSAGSQDIVIKECKLLEKTGGKSDFKRNQ